VSVAGGRRDAKPLDCVVLENVFAGGAPYSPVFDLKGASGRSRAAPGDAAVLLDENLAERCAQQDSPLCVPPAAAAALATAVWRDTAFLARVGVMDYSLLVGVQSAQSASGSDSASAIAQSDARAPLPRLRVGIVDYLRQYTWDKAVETVVKGGSSAVLALGGGGAGAQPTVISPRQYARRFRKAMRADFVVVPDVLTLPEEEEEAAPGRTRAHAPGAPAQQAGAA
jgi:1-phosphatidylinositol-3-phosphate 5-kinase